MYPASATFKDYIKRNTVDYFWSGTVVDVDNNSYDLTDENIKQNSGKITKRCGSDKLAVGTTCASELQMNLFLDVDRYTLFGAKVTLSFNLVEGYDAHDEPITEDVPMGVFTITECEQSNGKLSLLAYDDMTKFDDVPFIPTAHTDIKLPYAWLTEACSACGVTLGNTEAQIRAMPNGTRYLGYTDVASDVKSWRDAVGYISAVLGGYAYIGRDGKLYIGQYTNVSVDTISQSFRYSSDLSDYRTTYSGIHHICREAGVQEYAENTNEYGLVLDIGTNPFLQFTQESTRMSAIREIIDVWDGVYYVPFDVTMPSVPIYDVGDVITFTGNQAAEHDHGAITEIVYAIGNKMSIKCSGENPRLANTQDRFAKTVEGLGNEYDNTRNVGGKEFWKLSTTNTEVLSVGAEEVQVTEIEWNQKTQVQDLEMIFLADADLSATANVSVRIIVDDAIEYQNIVIENKTLKGTRPFPATNPQKIYGKGTHIAKVYMTVTDNPLTVGDLT